MKNYKKRFYQTYQNISNYKLRICIPEIYSEDELDELDYNEYITRSNQPYVIYKKYHKVGNDYITYSPEYYTYYIKYLKDFE